MSKSVKSNQSNQSNQLCIKGNNVSNGSNLVLSIKKVKSKKIEKKTKRISNKKMIEKKIYNLIDLKNRNTIEINPTLRVHQKEY